ncbi:hypothetical protein AAG570_005876 [Ranatra chinensis]|uniref:Integrase catalytic domain-containing protein n=1 Tax=Ranatra chinensis TaxID=642074 RepID=A0ABD0XWE3_9HEMI
MLTPTPEKPLDVVEVDVMFWAGQKVLTEIDRLMQFAFGHILIDKTMSAEAIARAVLAYNSSIHVLAGAVPLELMRAWQAPEGHPPPGVALENPSAKSSNSQIDGSSPALPYYMKIEPNINAPPVPQCRKDEELPSSEYSTLSYIVKVVDEFEAQYNYWMEQVQGRIPLSKTQNRTEIIREQSYEAKKAYSQPSRTNAVKSIVPTVNSVCHLSRTGESQNLRKQKEHEGGATEAYRSPEYKGQTSAEPSNTQNDGPTTAYEI